MAFYAMLEGKIYQRLGHCAIISGAQAYARPISYIIRNLQECTGTVNWYISVKTVPFAMWQQSWNGKLEPKLLKDDLFYDISVKSPAKID